MAGQESSVNYHESPPCTCQSGHIALRGREDGLCLDIKCLALSSFPIHRIPWCPIPSWSSARPPSRDVGCALLTMRPWSSWGRIENALMKTSWLLAFEDSNLCSVAARNLANWSNCLLLHHGLRRLDVGFAAFFIDFIADFITDFFIGRAMLKKMRLSMRNVAGQDKSELEPNFGWTQSIFNDLQKGNTSWF